MCIRDRYGNVVYKFCIKLTQNKEDGEVVLGKLIGLDKMICLSLILSNYFIAALCLCLLYCSLSVSYTHLDVYKRQVFMVIVDTIARSLVATEIPISILTAIVGAPFFITLMRRSGGWQL